MMNKKRKTVHPLDELAKTPEENDGTYRSYPENMEANEKEAEKEKKKARRRKAIKDDLDTYGDCCEVCEACEACGVCGVCCE